MATLRPMKEAPRDSELLAYHKAGKNLHQVKWSDYRERWTMRWCTDYEQRDGNYIGWLPMPEVELTNPQGDLTNEN